jgi:hypothetical protein
MEISDPCAGTLVTRFFSLSFFFLLFFVPVLVLFFFEFSPGGNESPPEYISKLPMRLFSLYKIGSNEQNTGGLQERSRKRKTHTPTKTQGR